MFGFYFRTAFIITMLTFTSDKIVHIWNLQLTMNQPENEEKLHPESTMNFNMFTTIHGKTSACGPGTRHNNVITITTRKCASTTVSNIMFRFTISHGLNALLPRDGLDFFKETKVEDVLPIPKGETYNILTNHCTLKANMDLISKTMPVDTVYIATIREPGKHAISFIYDEQILGGNKEQGDEARNPRPYLEKCLTENPSFKCGLRQNPISHFLGLPRGADIDNGQITRFISEVNNKFQLFLVVEQLDESLVLMKRFLCWELRDILSFTLNTISHPNSTEILKSEIIRNSIAQTRLADYKLYDFMRHRLSQQIDKEGPDFADEVVYFQKLKSLCRERCSEMRMSTDDVVNHDLVIGPSKWNKESITFTYHDCLLMTIGNTNKLTRFVRAYQTLRHNGSIPDEKMFPKRLEQVLVDLLNQ